MLCTVLYALYAPGEHNAQGSDGVDGCTWAGGHLGVVWKGHLPAM